MALLINGETVEDSVIREEVSLLRPAYEAAVQSADPVEREMQLREWSRENVIERVLLRQEALKNPEPIPAEQIEEALQLIRTKSSGQPNCILPQADNLLEKDIEIRLRIERLVQKVTSKVAPPKNKDISEFYRKHKEEFFTPELVRASHIVKNVGEDANESAALEAIRKIQQDLNEGASFEELADRYSDCPGNGGDLGYFPRGQMVEEFDRVVFAIDIGQTSDIFRSVFGFHIARVHDKKPAGIRALQEVRGEIEAALFRQKQERAMEDFLDRLKAKADIKNVRGGG